MAKGPSTTPTFVSLALVAAALVVSAIGGFSEGSLVGAALALAAVVPAAIGTWKGMQEETQGSMAFALVALCIALGVAGLLAVLKIVAWIS